MILAQTVARVKERVTAKDLWQMSSRGDNYELVKGVHYPDNTAHTLHKSDPLSDETIIPGFSGQVTGIFG